MKTFVKKLESAIKAKLGGDINIRTQEIIKNNDVSKTALNIYRQEDRCIANIYIDSFYRLYMQGALSLEEIVSAVLLTYEEKAIDTISTNDIIESISDYNKCKDKLFVKLLNAELNENYLSNKTYIQILDLALVLYYEVDTVDNTVSSVAINQNLFNSWGIEESVSEVIKNTLYYQSFINPAKIDCLYEAIHKLNPDIVIPDIPDGKSDIQIVTTNTGINGAVAMLYEGVLEQVADVIDDTKLLIIPSSIHETLIMPYRMFESELADFVKNVNATVVLPEEVLSNNIYVYDTETKVFNIWKE